MRTIITLFDHYLSKQGLQFQAVIIGGTALSVMGLITRQTKDIDCIDPVIPDEIKEAALEFRKSAPSLHLWENWLNNGPISLKKDLPTGWQERTVPLFEGDAISFRTLGRHDFLLSKLFALCDRQQDIDDCIALSPTCEELDQCLAWLYERDGNPYWPDNVRTSLNKLARILGYDYNPAM